MSIKLGYKIKVFFGDAKGKLYSTTLPHERESLLTQNKSELKTPTHLNATFDEPIFESLRKFAMLNSVSAGKTGLYINWQHNAVSILDRQFRECFRISRPILLQTFECILNLLR